MSGEVAASACATTADADRRAVQRFEGISERVLRALPGGSPQAVLSVADVGCGSGLQCQFWAERGHVVHGLDVDAALIDAARRRSDDLGLPIAFQVGAADALPWPDQSMDVCLAVELIEHVRQWERCLDEMVRVLRPGGLLYLSTTNRLCPKQQEYTLPLYSWYPGAVKRRYEKLALSSRPELARHSKYPAVNWFTFAQLRAALRQRGLTARDRFDMVALDRKGPRTRAVVQFVRRVPPARWLAHVAMPSTVLLAHKAPGTGEAVARRAPGVTG